MLNFVRAKDVDYVPTVLNDAEIYKTLPQGSWVLPSGVNPQGEVEYGVPAAIDPVADINAIRNAKISFSEPNRTDTKDVNKITTLRGVLTLETNQFIAADEPNMGIGVPLTLKKDADGFVKLGTLAAATDQVVAVVDVAPSANPEANLIFHATLY